MANVPLADATREQLVYFAETVLGMAEVDGRWSKDTLIGRIAVIDPDLKAIEVPEQAPRAAVPNVGAVKAKSGDGTKPSKDDPERKVIIRVTTGGANDFASDRPVSAAVNGKAILIPREEDVAVAYKFYEALLHTQMEVANQAKDARITSWRRSQRYPVSLVYDPAA